MSFFVNNNPTPNYNSLYSSALDKNAVKAAAKYADKEVAKEKASESSTTTNNKDIAATYEGSNRKTSNGLYSINQMNQADRKAIAERMMQEFEAKKGTMSDLVQQMFTKQGQASNLASLFTPEALSNVSSADILQAQDDISEEGYWGVKETSKRLFDFASALAGDDPEKMKKMEAAMEKGFKKAEKAWGKELPEISQQTMDAARKLFADYYQSKKDVFTE